MPFDVGVALVVLEVHGGRVSHGQDSALASEEICQARILGRLFDGVVSLELVAQGVPVTEIRTALGSDPGWGHGAPDDGAQHADASKVGVVEPRPDQVGAVEVCPPQAGRALAVTDGAAPAVSGPEQ